MTTERQRVRGGSPPSTRKKGIAPCALLEAAVLVVLTGFILWHLSPMDLLRNTTTVGGDTPAHNYLASHLREQLLHHGRVISWAGGWWCGFPMFQYYFCLPYLLIALLSTLLPFNLAFKIICVSGAVLLPSSAYLSARWMRLPKPIPVLLAAMMVPFLFVRTHSMWGVNLTSTLAGMISNSLSFTLMLPAIASAYRDAEDGRFRMRTVFLLALVMASHFFTSVMAGVVLAVVPLLCLRTVAPAASGIRLRLREMTGTLRVLLLESGLAVLLMAWWLVPLIAKSEFSMEFGTNWDLALWHTFPEYAAGLIPFAVVAIAYGVRRGHCGVWLFAWMLATGVTLFHFGFRLSPVFVNVRLWPFVFFALVALGAVGLGFLLDGARWPLLASMIVAILAGVTLEDRIPGVPGPGLVRSWARYNFGGLERKPAARVFDELVLPLKGTPGRLANDLCEENNELGSSRVFELAPHLAGKPILEGGLVNSAIGSMSAYYVQGETSQNCAGFPPIVVPTTFNITNATRHLELFNVKHFIARWAVTQQALRGDPRWKFIRREREWELYELMSHDGRYVFIPPAQPAVVETKHWKECSLEWLYEPKAIDQPFMFCQPGQAPPLSTSGPRLTETQFRQYLSSLRGPDGVARIGQAVRGGHIRDEVVTDDRIAFTTDAVGSPHIIKCSYYPNWKVRGARQVFMVSPTFMLVFPEREQVELYYGVTWSDLVGQGLTALGWCLVVVTVWRWRTGRQEARV